MPPLARKKIIIDTNGDIANCIALLFAFADAGLILDVLLVTVTSSDEGMMVALTQVLTMFQQLQNDLTWRQQEPDDVKFKELRDKKPIVAIGCSQPLTQGESVKQNFGDQTAYRKIWQAAEERSSLSNDSNVTLITPSLTAAHEEILHALRINDPGSITLVALTSLTTIATAAVRDPQTFLRLNELVVIGGAMNEETITTMSAESHTYQDPVAAARLFALTSPTPSSTMPPGPSYPENLSGRLSMLLFPLENTNDRLVTEERFDKIATQQEGSPLMKWAKTMLEPRIGDGVAAGKMRLRSPVALLYAASPRDWQAWRLTFQQDIRVQLDGPAKGLCRMDKSNKTAEGGWIDESIGNRLIIGQHDASATVYDMLVLGMTFSVVQKVRARH